MVFFLSFISDNYISVFFNVPKMNMENDLEFRASLITFPAIASLREKKE